MVQLYLHDPVASISQPVRRLRGFERVTLAPGEMKTVTFKIDKSDFGFYDNSGKFVVEPGAHRPLRRQQLEGDDVEVVHRHRRRLSAATVGCGFACS